MRKARNYLSKLGVVESRIRELRNQVELLKEQAESRSSNLSPDKVQSSGSASRQADTICKWVDIEKEIEREEMKRQEIVDVIESLEYGECKVLMLYYRFNKFLKEIAAECNRSYSWVTKKHADGLKSVEQILNEKKVGT